MKGFYVKTTLPGELIELLEVIVLQGSDLFKNKNHLQNLLILTGDPSVCPSRKVMECITSTVWITCDDKPDIAKIIAVGEEVYCLYEEEALAINIKCWQERVTRGDDEQKTSPHRGRGGDGGSDPGLGPRKGVC